MRRAIPFFAALLILASWSCREKITVQPPPPPEAPSSQSGGASLPGKSAPVAADPALTVKPAASLGPLDRGELYFRQGKYPEAVRNYEEFLKSNPENEGMDGILFNLGLSCALSPDSDRNLPAAKTTLSRLVSEYPNSRYRSQAQLILSLITQVEQLNLDVRERDSSIQALREELKKLKEIDLKRRPSRP
jgi:tetratricopeptide (TPR) repeat protein